MIIARAPAVWILFYCREILIESMIFMFRIVFIFTVSSFVKLADSLNNYDLDGAQREGADLIRKLQKLIFVGTKQGILKVSCEWLAYWIVPNCES